MMNYKSQRVKGSRYNPKWPFYLVLFVLFYLFNLVFLISYRDLIIVWVYQFFLFTLNLCFDLATRLSKNDKREFYNRNLNFDLLALEFWEEMDEDQQKGWFLQEERKQNQLFCKVILQNRRSQMFDFLCVGLWIYQMIADKFSSHLLIVSLFQENLYQLFKASNYIHR